MNAPAQFSLERSYSSSYHRAAPSVTFSSHLSPPRLSRLWWLDAARGEVQTRPVKCWVNMNWMNRALSTIGLCRQNLI